MILFLVTIFILKLLFQKEFRPSFEIVYVALFLTLIYFVGFLDNAGGGLFLAFILGISLFYRLIKSVVYFRITLIGMAILLNGLLTFKFLQSAEIFLLYQSTRNRYEMKEINLNHWKYDEKARRLSNEDIPLYLTLPEGSYFFKPDDLDLKEKTGTGQVAGIVSVSDTNPNLYPYVRLFLIPAYVTVDIDTIRSEISSLIDVAVHRGEMNEIKPIGDQKLLSKKWPGYFWIFYDIIRPRYAKTGFYLMTLKSGDRILIHMMENIVKGQFHEKEIIELLESISEDPQSKN